MELFEKLKAFTWKQWLGWSIIAIVFISAIVLHLIQPKMPYSVFEFALVISFVAGGLTSCLIRKSNEKKENEKQLLTD